MKFIVEFRQALIDELLRVVDGCNKTRFEYLAEELVNHAITGDVDAMKLIFDRVLPVPNLEGAKVMDKPDG